MKTCENLGIHGLNGQSLENTFSGIPWFYQNSGDAKGVEFTLRNRFSRYSLTQSYTLSRMIFNFSVFNLLNRNNVWYKNYAFSFNETHSIPRLRPLPVDLLDLGIQGIQPSFSVKYSF